jgi:hypothetical protein
VGLTTEQFNIAVTTFSDDVALAVDCFPTPWTVDGTLASPDDGERLRAVVDAKVNLCGGSENELAELGANYKLCVDSYGQHLAVEHSSFVLKAKVDRTPIIRWDFDRAARSKPNSHVQITAHRGALSHLLSQLDHKTPHSIESLHVPMGGERFRPCLEDIVEFLIRDCGFRGKDDWKAVVREGRAKWRRIQIRAVVRDSPAQAAAALAEMGYSVTPPGEGQPDERIDKLTAW